MHLFVILILGYLSTGILAGGRQNGYERVWLWYAYTLDRQRPAGDRVMKDCISLDPGPIPCHFTEFMETVDGETRGVYWNDYPDSHYVIPFVDDDAPDPKTVADRIYYRGWNTNFAADGFMKTQGLKYQDMIKAVGDIFKDCRNDPALLARSANIYSQGDECLRQVTGYRYADYSSYIIDDAKTNLPGIKVVTAPSEWGDVLDWDETLKDPANAGVADLETKIDNFILLHDDLNYQEGKSARHWVVLEFWSNAKSAMAGICT